MRKELKATILDKSLRLAFKRPNITFEEWRRYDTETFPGEWKDCIVEVGNQPLANAMKAVPYSNYHDGSCGCTHNTMDVIIEDHDGNLHLHNDIQDDWNSNYAYSEPRHKDGISVAEWLQKYNIKPRRIVIVVDDSSSWNEIRRERQITIYK